MEMQLSHELYLHKIIIYSFIPSQCSFNIWPNPIKKKHMWRDLLLFHLLNPKSSTLSKRQTKHWEDCFNFNSPIYSTKKNVRTCSSLIWQFNAEKLPCSIIQKTTLFKKIELAHSNLHNLNGLILTSTKNNSMFCIFLPLYLSHLLL